ncbi:hypothetical protein Chls_269 [Chlamydia suis]|uniref:Uncharacterized protein n=1 Tax=Chlamydia suis TaxID=83559 RepID=A0ABX6IPX7_9CHLA|nr:hypothetical protein Chls_269 [Chlamydia suis]
MDGASLEGYLVLRTWRRAQDLCMGLDFNCTYISVYTQSLVVSRNCFCPGF